MFELYPDEYLNLVDGDEELENLIRIQNYIFKDTKYNENHHLEMIKIYKEVLNKLSIILKNNLENDIFVYNGALSALTWNGYISYQKKFRFDESGQLPLDLNGYFGLDVLFGIGCCRNLSFLFNDLLRQNNFSSNFIVNDEYDIKSDYMNLNLKRYTVDEEELEKGLFFTYEDSYDVGGHHACIIFPYKKNYFVYDPTNIQIYVVNGTKGEKLFGKGKMNIQPGSLMIYNGYDNDEMNMYFENLIRSKKSRINDELLIDKIYNGSNYVLENKKLFDEFYNNISSDLEKLNNEKQKILLSLNNQYDFNI